MTNMALEPSYRIMLDQFFLSALSTIKALFRKKIVKRLKNITEILLRPIEVSPIFLIYLRFGGRYPLGRSKILVMFFNRFTTTFLKKVLIVLYTDIKKIGLP